MSILYSRRLLDIFPYRANVAWSLALPHRAVLLRQRKRKNVRLWCLGVISQDGISYSMPHKPHWVYCLLQKPSLTVLVKFRSCAMLCPRASSRTSITYAAQNLVRFSHFSLKSFHQGFLVFWKVVKEDGVLRVRHRLAVLHTA
jgi:hypothetical protein